jgi:hypothetical protein
MSLYLPFYDLDQEVVFCRAVNACKLTTKNNTGRFRTVEVGFG